MAKILKKENISALGLALVFIGIPIGMYFKVFCGWMNLNRVLVFVGLLMVFPYKYFLKRINKIPKLFGGILFFHIIAITYYFFSENGDTMDLVYELVVLILCLALICTHKEELSIEKTIIYLWILSAFCAVCTVYMIKSGMVGIYSETTSQYTKSSDGRIMFEFLTAAGTCITNVCCSCYIFLKIKKRKIRLLLVIFILIDLYGILLSQKRTPFIVATFIILFFLYYNKVLNKLFQPKFFIWYIVIFIAAVITISQSNELMQLYDNLSEGITNGLKDMIFGVKVYDGNNSTAIRYYTRMHALDIISNFSWINYIFGKGYMTLWCDMPLLQAYLDMGILGVIFVTNYMVVFPFKLIIKARKLSYDTIWALVNASYIMISCLNSGTPYGHAKWIPLLILAFCYNNSKYLNKSMYNL